MTSDGLLGNMLSHMNSPESFAIVFFFNFRATYKVFGRLLFDLLDVIDHHAGVHFHFTCLECGVQDFQFVIWTGLSGHQNERVAGTI